MFEPHRAWKLSIPEIPLCPLWPGKRWCWTSFRLSLAWLTASSFYLLKCSLLGDSLLEPAAMLWNAKAPGRYFSSQPHLCHSVHAGIVNASVWIFQPRRIFRWYSPGWHLIDCVRRTTWKLVVWVQSSQRTLRDNEWFQATDYWGARVEKLEQRWSWLHHWVDVHTEWSGCQLALSRGGRGPLLLAIHFTA